jgi:hypothetical protein
VKEVEISERRCKFCGYPVKVRRTFCARCGSLIRDSLRDQILSLYFLEVINELIKGGKNVLDAREDFEVGGKKVADYYFELEDKVELAYLVQSRRELGHMVFPLQVKDKDVKVTVILAYLGDKYKDLEMLKEASRVYEVVMEGDGLKLTRLK